MPWEESMADSVWRTRLLDLEGLPLLPCGAGADYKAPLDPKTGRQMSGWQHQAFTPGQIAAMNGSVLCVGLRLGPPSGGLIAFDPDGASAIEEAVRRGCDPMAADTWRIHRTTSDDHLKLVFRVPQERWSLLERGKGRICTRAAANGEKGQQLEAFWSSGQVIVLGEHRSSGGQYVWSGSPERIATIPDAWWELALELLGPRSSPPVQPPSPSPLAASDDLRRAEDALRFLDPDLSHDAWVEIGMALHSAAPEAGFALWDAWSSRGRKYPGHKALAQRWRSFRPGGGITIATLFRRAQTHGWVNPLVEVSRSTGRGCNPTAPSASSGPPVALSHVAVPEHSQPQVGDPDSGQELDQEEPDHEPEDICSAPAQYLELSDRLAEGRRVFSFEGMLPADLARAVELLHAPLPTDVISAVLPLLCAYTGVLRIGNLVKPNLSYDVPINLFFACVAMSGIAKTSIKRTLVDSPIEPIKKDAKCRNELALEEWQRQNRELKKADRSPEPGMIHPVIQSYTPAALNSQLHINDVHGRGQLIVVDELSGLLNAISQDTRNGSGTAEAQLLETFDGSGYTGIRVVAATRFYSACHVSIYGNIQPKRLRQFVNGRDDTGQFARFLFCRIPTRPLILPDDDPTDEEREAHSAAVQLLQRYALRLHALSPRTYEMTAVARRRFNAWFKAYQNRAQTPGTPTVIASLLGKTAAHAMRLAGILHLLAHVDALEADAEQPGPHQRIGDEVMDIAMAIVDQLTEETIAFHETPLDSTTSEEEAAWDAAEAARLQLLRHIHHLSWTTQAPITRQQAKDKASRQMRRHCSSQAFQACVGELVAQGFGELVAGERGANGKRRSVAYRATREMSF